MILAELEVFHSRNYSPTRRLALGYRDLPLDPPPGMTMSALQPRRDPDTPPASEDSLDESERDLLRRADRALAGREGSFIARFLGILPRKTTEGASPLQMTLAATYAAGQLPLNLRPRVFDVLRAGLRWRGPIGPSLITHLSGRHGAPAWSAAAYLDPSRWALDVLGFGDRPATPTKREVQRTFRRLVRDAHPDHGAESEGAAQRIAELTEARRILLP